LLHAFYIALAVGALTYLLVRERLRFTISSATLMFMFVLYGGGYLYFLWTSTRVSLIVLERTTLCLMAMWICVIAGMEAARVLFPRAAVRADRLYDSWDRTRIVDDAGSINLPVAVGVATAGFLILQFLLGDVLVSVAEFLAQETTQGRREARFLYGGAGGYLYNVMGGALGAWLSFYLLAKWWVTRKRILLATWALLASTLLVAKFGTLAKAPWVLFAMQTLLVFYVVRRISVRPRTILVFGVVGVATLVFTASIAFPGAQVGSIFLYLVRRIFYIPNEGLYQTLYVYPDYLPHTQGLNVGLFHRLFGTGDLTPAYSRVADFFGAFEANYNALFIADAWVDFSWAGVIGISLLVGVVIKLVDLYYAQLGKTPLTVSCFIAGLYGIDQLLATSAFTAFLSGGLLSIPLLVLLARGAGKVVFRRKSPAANFELGDAKTSG
jgi:hypothetical protein